MNVSLFFPSTARLYTLGSIYITKFAIDLSPRSRYYSGERRREILGRRETRDFARFYFVAKERLRALINYYEFIFFFNTYIYKSRLSSNSRVKFSIKSSSLSIVYWTGKKFSIQPGFVRPLITFALARFRKQVRNFEAQRVLPVNSRKELVEGNRVARIIYAFPPSWTRNDRPSSTRELLFAFLLLRVAFSFPPSFHLVESRGREKSTLVQSLIGD